MQESEEEVLTAASWYKRVENMPALSILPNMTS